MWLKLLLTIMPDWSTMMLLTVALTMTPLTMRMQATKTKGGGGYREVRDGGRRARRRQDERANSENRVEEGDGAEEGLFDGAKEGWVK